MWSYLRNQRSKHKNFVNLRFLRIMHSFPKTGSESFLKKNFEYENTLYNSIELSVDLISREFQKLYYFQERVSFRYNIILNLLSVSYMLLAKKLISKKELFF